MNISKSNRISLWLKNCTIIGIATVLVFCASISQAMENGNWSYASGTNSFPARLSPKGLNVLNTTSYRHNSNLKDNSGNDVPIDYDVKAYVSSFNFLYNTGKQFMGGYLALYTVVPLVSVDLETPMGKDSASGVSDISVGISNAYVSKNWVVVPSLEVMFPTGAYDKDEIASVGYNRYIFEPYVMVNYTSDSGFAVATKTMFDYTTENPDTDYQSGMELHMDYAVGQHLGPWTIGAAGYLYKQITDDKVNGNTIDDYRAQAVGVGPTVGYSYKNIDVSLQYTKDYMVRNKGEGEQFWLKVYCSF